MRATPSQSAPFKKNQEKAMSGKVCTSPKVRKQRGVALILTLVAIAVVALLAAGIGNLVIGHFDSASRDQDAAKALDVAEAALYSQVQKINANINGAQVAFNGSNQDAATYGLATYNFNDPAHPVGQPYPVGSIPPMRDYLRLGTEDSCLSWADPALNLYSASNTFLYGSGTVNRVTRTVRAKWKLTGVFDTYGCFGITSLQFNEPTGTEIRVVNTESALPGVVGTNGSLTKTGAPEVDKLMLYGNAANILPNPPFKVPGSPSRDLTPELNAQPVKWPPIATIANQTAAYVRDYTGSGRASYQSALTTDSGILNFKGSNNDNAWALAVDEHGGSIGYPTNGSIPAGATLTLRGKTYGANYYMTGLKVGGSGAGILVVDVSQGPVSLWINRPDTGSAQDDQISGNISVVSNDGLVPDISRFRIYYHNESGGKLSLTGSGARGSEIYAMIYAYDTGVTGRVDVEGNVTLTGSIIANTLRLDSQAGDITIKEFPNTDAEPGEGLLYFGLNLTWAEYDPVRKYGS